MSLHVNLYPIYLFHCCSVISIILQSQKEVGAAAAGNGTGDPLGGAAGTGTGTGTAHRERAGEDPALGLGAERRTDRYRGLTGINREPPGAELSAGAPPAETGEAAGGAPRSS